MIFLTPQTQPPIITGVPIPYPNVAHASRTGEILQFDEADAIFGTRTQLLSAWGR